MWVWENLWQAGGPDAGRSGNRTRRPAVRPRRVQGAGAEPERSRSTPGCRPSRSAPGPRCWPTASGPTARRRPWATRFGQPHVPRRRTRSPTSRAPTGTSRSTTCCSNCSPPRPPNATGRWCAWRTSRRASTRRSLQASVDALIEEQVPFAIAVIPEYHDGKGGPVVRLQRPSGARRGAALRGRPTAAPSSCTASAIRSTASTTRTAVRRRPTTSSSGPRSTTEDNVRLLGPVDGTIRGRATGAARSAASTSSSTPGCPGRR